MSKKITKNIKNKIKSLKLFDWILIIAGICVVFVFATIFFRKSSYITATVKVGDDSVFYNTWLTGTFNWSDTSGSKSWFAEAFHKGQSEKDGLGNIKASVLDVFSYDKSPAHKVVYLTVKLNVVYNRASNTYTYKGVPVLVGSQIKLNLDNVYANGTVTDVEGFPGKKENKYLILETQIRDQNQTFLETVGTKNYVAEALNIGEEVKDNNGNVLLQILDKNVLPAKKTVTTADGRIFAQDDPIQKDVFLTIGVNAEKIGDKYYFLDDTPILVDQIIPINTPTISVFPVITKILTD